jgi:hypothetical protein
LEYPKGSKELRYEGDTIDGVPSGNGTLIFKSGEKFEGQFEKGLIDGHGKLIYPGIE